MNVSVIVTVKNEGKNQGLALRGLLDSLIDQTQPPDEVVVVDGGSTDDTLDIIAEYREWLPLKVIAAPGSNISQGRNVAVGAAKGPLIAATDAGVILSPVWVEEISRPLKEESSNVVSGWFEADPYTDFEVVMGATVLPDLDEIDPDTFLPSSRSVAFRKETWAAAGGYPEWLDYSEDLVFDLNLKAHSPPFIFAPYAVAFFRPRASLTAFFRQYYFYARGDGKANLWPRRHLIRYLTYLVALPLIGRLIWRAKWYGWLFLAVGIGAYCRRPAERLWPQTNRWRPPSRVRAFALIPIIRLIGDVAKMIGYPVGLWWRWRNRPPQ